ncbi:maleylacetoacetate isomerase [Lampropedia puyangensis]|uniref:Maleylacetoacetate isomerase n=1 Tax=Lampropedia puyangensis TaxID=1330072 RepID=A0A4S8FAT8_9BURK|nr:maleylacetoacetate isomerase [Lampropedia puyangensis]THU04590.1 maleylacetoacetate isomerase [Lampropedia puyangensis]
MDLYNYFYSSTSYRARIALALKGLDFNYIAVNLRTLEQRSEAFLQRNRAGGVPLLVDGDFSLSQSLAILDYLEQTHPAPALLPQDPAARARVLELSYAVACDIHPVNNQRVLRYLQTVLNVTEEQKQDWYTHWIAEGLAAVEQLLVNEKDRGGTGPYAFGAQPTWADCCLVPQVANALRMKCDISAYPLAHAVYTHCIAQPAFAKAAPFAQPDAPAKP